MKSGNLIRMALESDSQEVLNIYSAYIKETCITFEYIVPSCSEFTKRIHNVLEKLPWLVCEIDGNIAGYAYVSKHRERAAYQWSVDVSVYVGPAYHRRHIATALYTALFKIVTSLGYYNAFAGIASPNAASERLHESFGFKEIGVFHNVGYKLGNWHDVRWFEKTLSAHPEKPEPPKPIYVLKETELKQIFRDAEKIIK